MSLLEVRDLTVAFPTDTESVSAVRGMNFHVDPGEVVALVGESGAGKSASAMAVVGLLPEYAEVSGSMRLHGDELIGLSDQTDVGDPRQDHRHGVPGPDVGAHPRLHRRRPDRRSDRDPPTRHHPPGRPRPRDRTARARRYRPAGTAGPVLPPRTVRRRATACGDRDRDRQRSGSADLRRADHRPGRHGAGADPRRARDRARRHGRRRSDHHARPRCGRRVREPGTGDVRRKARRGRIRRGAIP